MNNKIYNPHVWDGDDKENRTRMKVKCLKCGHIVNKDEKEECTVKENIGDDYRLGMNPDDEKMYQENRSNVNLRYKVDEAPFNAFGVFTVFDQKEDRVICQCHERKDADKITELLNGEEAKEYVRSIP